MYADYAETVLQDEGSQLDAYLPLVKRIVRQLSSQCAAVIEREDMEQIGVMALLESLRRYGVPDERFAGFAVLRVRGAILDELRRLDWRPRAVRQDAHKVRDGLRELTRKLGHEPGEAEACALLGLSAQAYGHAMQAESAEAMASLDELLAAGHEPGGMSRPDEALLDRLSLAQALRLLDEREQRVIQLYYEFDLSLKEIALVLDLTEARVCQINKAALKKMKMRLAA
ncbi:FliA/WhiG family RNA polymerase sigma factor [Rhodobacteraceae bacterium CH30]|nr:FliA/WhiG family RNA polymerase sigma factor [Rhodobacteraceae bacterium CH30]